MIAFTPRTQRLGDIHVQVVGVFEDDALLLLVAARSRSMEWGCSPTSGPIDADDLALEVARLADAERWDL